MLLTVRRAAKLLAAAAILPASLLIAATTTAAAAPARAGAQAWPAQRYLVQPILFGNKLKHTFTPPGSAKTSTGPLTQPDDITHLGSDLFSAFQNGLGPQGQVGPGNDPDSTVVEYTASGRVIQQWDVKGHCDGLTADPAEHLVIATVNEDANSSIFTITPGAPADAQVVHYRYNDNPLPHNGGTDAISIYRGLVLISASAPGTAGKPAPQPTYPAVYSVTFDRATLVATVKPVFYDEAPATVANVKSADFGKVVRLGLTDPDSNEVVPQDAFRFAGDFMLTSQGDKEQIFTGLGGGLGRHLSVLRLTQSVDDTAWVSSRWGHLYADDHDGDTVDMVSGPFRVGSVFVAVTPCDANGAPATCPAPGFPPNYLGSLNPWTGTISRVPVTGPNPEPQGMIFVAG
jgi:hypothetical protein